MMPNQNGGRACPNNANVRPPSVPGTAALRRRKDTQGQADQKSKYPGGPRKLSVAGIFS